MITNYYFKNIVKQKNDGFFIEIGVGKGKTENSTKILESNGWSGACIEPVVENVKRIKKHRKCRIINGALWVHDGTVEFMETSIPGHSGIVQTHRDSTSAIKTYNVNCYKFESLDFPKYIDYIQLDTEGSELEIIKSIDHTNYYIKHICIEDRWGFLNQDKTYYNNIIELGYRLIYQEKQDFLYEKQ